jgi:hypothetical protein
MDYKFPLEQCHVRNFRSLKRYREARIKWMRWLDGDEHHSVWKQIDAMVMNDAVYRLVNECRRFATKEAPTAASNPLIGRFVDLGYVATQVLAIWKLMEQRDDVISLRRLFDSISNSFHLFTRENYVAYDGLPYDPYAAGNAYYGSMSTDDVARLHGVPTEGPQAFGQSEVLHLAFDRLSGMMTERRKRTDTIDPRVFRTIGDWFKDPVFETLAKLRHTFVAHAGDEKSRAAAGLSDIGTTLGEIERAHYLIVRIAQTISAQILYGGSHQQIIPILQYGQLADLDAQYVPKDAINELSRWWLAHMKSRFAWAKEPFALP